MNTRYKSGEAVQINNPVLREHGVVGEVKFYDDEIGFYWVELDQGPPWRGQYGHWELAPKVE